MSRTLVLAKSTANFQTAGLISASFGRLASNLIKIPSKSVGSTSLIRADSSTKFKISDSDSQHISRTVQKPIDVSLDICSDGIRTRLLTPYKVSA